MFVRFITENEAERGVSMTEKRVFEYDIFSENNNNNNDEQKFEAEKEKFQPNAMKTIEKKNI